MVDDLPVSVDEIEVAGGGQVHILADLLDAAEAHVHQQHAALNGTGPGQLHLPAEGHHPAILVIRVLKEVLHMGRGKVEVFDPLHGGGEPGLLLRIDAVFEPHQRRGGDQLPLLGEQCDGHQGVPVVLVEQVQIL